MRIYYWMNSKEYEMENCEKKKRKKKDDSDESED